MVGSEQATALPSAAVLEATRLDLRSHDTPHRASVAPIFGGSGTRNGVIVAEASLPRQLTRLARIRPHDSCTIRTDGTITCWGHSKPRQDLSPRRERHCWHGSLLSATDIRRAPAQKAINKAVDIQIGRRLSIVAVAKRILRV